MWTKYFLATTAVFFLAFSSPAVAQHHGRHHSSHHGGHHSSHHGGHHSGHHRSHHSGHHSGFQYNGHGLHFGSGHHGLHFDFHLPQVYYPSNNYQYYYPSNNYQYYYSRPYGNYGNFDYYGNNQYRTVPQYTTPQYASPQYTAPYRSQVAKPSLKTIPVPRLSNAKARDRAARYRQQGDALFLKQRFYEASQSYKSASKSAPDIAEYYFRLGHAYIATHQYSLAAAAFKRGLATDDSWVDSDFRLKNIYADNHAAKMAHIESLADNALNDTRNGDWLFLLGVTFHYDSKPERAQKFFHRANDLTVGDKAHLQPFVAGLASKATKKEL